MHEFKSIILQPISNTKNTWAKYDKNQDDFLTFFQETFKNEIKGKFHVNHKTEKFSDYLLIPYYTANKKCFGAYYISSGSKINYDNYSWCYNIDYSKSYNFTQEISKFDFINELEFNNDTLEVHGKTLYYESSELSKKSKEYILSFCNKTNIKKEK